MSIIQRAINGLDIQSELPPISGNANKYLKVNNNANDVEWSLLADSVALPDGTEGAPAEYFANDTDTGIYRIGNNNIGISCGGTLDMSISDTQTIIRNNLLVNNNGLFFENDNDTGFTRINPNQVAIRCGGSDSIQVGTSTINMIINTNFSSNINEPTIAPTVSNATNTFTYTNQRLVKHYYFDITALSTADLSIIFSSNFASGDHFFITIAHSNTVTTSRIATITFSQETTFMGGLSTQITAGIAMTIHTQVPNLPTLTASYSQWLFYKAGTNIHALRIGQSYQEMTSHTQNVSGQIISGFAGTITNPNYTFSGNATKLSSGMFWNDTLSLLSFAYNGVNRLNMNATTCSINNNLNVTSNVLENNWYVGLTNASPSLTITNRQYRCISIEISALSSPNGTLIIPALEAGMYYIIQVYNNSGNNGRVLNLQCGSTMWDVVNLQTITANANYTLHTQNSLKSYSQWLLFRHGNGPNAHISRLTAYNQDTQLNYLSTQRLTIGAQGTASTPSITFNPPDTNTNSGLYASADNVINISCNGVNQFEVSETIINHGTALYKFNEPKINTLVSLNANTTYTWAQILGVGPLIRMDVSGGNRTITLPVQTTEGVYPGMSISVFKYGSATNTLTIAVSTGAYINGTLNGTHVITGGQNYQHHRIVYLGDTSNAGLGWAVLS